MKRNLLFTVILLFTAIFAYSQIVVQSTSAYSIIDIEEKERASNYRGDVELTLTIGDGDHRSVGCGFTFNTSHGGQINHRIWLGVLLGISCLDKTRVGYRGYVESYTGGGIHIAPKIKINLWNEPRHSWMPYLSVAAGIFSGEQTGFYEDFKAGFTHYNRKRSLGVSPCLGLSILGRPYIPYGNVGVNIEFGGTKAFNK